MAKCRECGGVGEVSVGTMPHDEMCRACKGTGLQPEAAQPCACTTWGGCKDHDCPCDCHKQAAQPQEPPAAPSPAREPIRELGNDSIHGLHEAFRLSPTDSYNVECKCGQRFRSEWTFDAHLRAEVRRELLRELEFVAQDFDDWKAERCAKHLREWMKVEREGQ